MIDEAKLLTVLEQLREHVGQSHGQLIHDRNSQIFYGGYTACLADVLRTVERLRTPVSPSKKA